MIFIVDLPFIDLVQGLCKVDLITTDKRGRMDGISLLFALGYELTLNLVSRTTATYCGRLTGTFTAGIIYSSLNISRQFIQFELK